jgi:hypothetical protein
MLHNNLSLLGKEIKLWVMYVFAANMPGWMKRIGMKVKCPCALVQHVANPYPNQTEIGIEA